MSDPVATLLHKVADMIASGLPRPNWILGLANPYGVERPSLCFASAADLEAWGSALGVQAVTREPSTYRPYEIREIITDLAGLTSRLWADVSRGAGDAPSKADTPAPLHD